MAAGELWITYRTSTSRYLNYYDSSNVRRRIVLNSTGFTGKSGGDNQLIVVSNSGNLGTVLSGRAYQSSYDGLTVSPSGPGTTVAEVWISGTRIYWLYWNNSYYAQKYIQGDTF